MSRCLECGRSKFDRHGACEYCGMVSYEVQDAILKAQSELRDRLAKEKDMNKK